MDRRSKIFGNNGILSKTLAGNADKRRRDSAMNTKKVGINEE